MRLVFLGTPDIAVTSLDALAAAGHEIALVVTGPARRRSRGSTTSATPVARRALELDIPVSHIVADATKVNAQLGVVVAFGKMIPAGVLDQLSMLNVHFSQLPRWRGAAPLERAILAGDATTAVAIMQLEATLDTGPIVATREVAIGDLTISDLRVRAAQVGAELLLDVLAAPEQISRAEPQVGDATYASKITALDYELNPDESFDMNLRRVRLERAFTFIAGERLLITHVEATPGAPTEPGVARCVGDVIELGARDGTLRVTELRPAGRATMSAGAWWRGQRMGSDAQRWPSSSVPSASTL